MTKKQSVTVVVAAVGLFFVIALIWRVFSEPVREQILFQACGNGSIKMVRHLLDSGTNPNARDGWNGSCMFYAAANGHTEIADLLLSRGIEVDLAYRMDKTALIMAAGAGRLDMVNFLIDHKANVNLLDTDGKSALDHAIEQKHLPTAEILSRATQRNRR